MKSERRAFKDTPGRRSADAGLLLATVGFHWPIAAGRRCLFGFALCKRQAACPDLGIEVDDTIELADKVEF